MQFLFKVLRFIFVPEGQRAKAAYVLFLIFIGAVLAFGLDFPATWNTYASRWHIPHFGELGFKLGLDLKGGTHLVYVADLSNITPNQYAEAMSGLRDVIERRVNSFGVSEPNVQTAQSGAEYRLIVDLAGVQDVKQAIAMIGQTPYLEFKEQRTPQEMQAILDAQKKGQLTDQDPYFKVTDLTGRYLQRSEVTFDPQSYKPVVNLHFDSTGSTLFEQITGRNVGKQLAIYLDGSPISEPKVNEAISGGSAIITGNFTIEEAKQMVQRLNSGALPVPVKLISQQTVEASLGAAALRKSFIAGLWALAVVAVFMVLWYRIPGVLAVFALLLYTLFVLGAFKLLGITLTLAGIVGFILSIGMAVDANILIFARMREEFRAGKKFDLAVHDAFLRAWPSIRDSNISTLLTCFVLYFFTSSLIKGFALTLAIGVLVSMFSAIFITRMLLRTVIGGWVNKLTFLWYR